MRLSFYQRFARPILWLTLLVLPLAVFGATQAVRLTKNRIIDWLPSNFEETQKLMWFNDRFGSDEILAISWPECTLDNQQIAPFVEALKGPHPFPDGAKPIFREVISGQTIYTQMTSPPLDLPPAQAKERMQGWLLGKDEKTTCVIARIIPNPDGTFSREEAVQFAEQTAASMAKPLQLETAQLKIAGPTADSAAINIAGAENINLMRIAAVALGLGLAWMGLRNFLQVTNVFATALLATLLSLASVYFCGQYMDAILLPLPALVFVLTVSGAVHLTHYYTESARHHGTEQAATLAMKVGGMPCALAGITTMIGLASLSVSNVLPVRRFGLLSALGVGLGLICLLLVWPALAQRFQAKVTGSLDHKSRTPRTPRTSSWWQPIYWLGTHGRWGVLAISIVAIPMLVVGLSRINTSVNLSSLLPADSPLLQSYDWFDENIGPLVPVEVVLEFPTASTDDSRSTYERAQLVESLRQRIHALDESGGTYAATTFAPDLPTATGARQIAQQRILGNKLLKRRDLFVERGLIALHEDQELWRVSTRVSNQMGDYGPFLHSLNEVVDDFTHEMNPETAGAGPVFTTQVCGSIPLIQKAQNQLLLDLIRSMLVAAGLICVAMIVLLRSPMAGLISMIPNVFPSLLVLGIMGYRGKVVDIGTMMTASVALGIAVDDTLHFLVWFRRSVREGANRITAIRVAFDKCAGAMLQTSIICGFGMLPFAYSSFGPVSRFSGGMIALLAAALVGDLIILPAILASPLGRFFADAPLGLASADGLAEQTERASRAERKNDLPSERHAEQFKPI